MTIVSATELQSKFDSIAHTAVKSHEVYHVHAKEGDLVLMSELEYEGLIETLDLLSIKGFQESVLASQQEKDRGETVSFDEVFGESL